MKATLSQMQNNLDPEGSFNYLLALLQKALSENVFTRVITRDEIRQIIQEEFLLLITKRSKSNLENSHYFGSEIPKRLTISSKIGWLKDASILLRLYTYLISHGFIACDFEFFKAHFIHNKGTSEPIIWLSNTNRLVYLFDQLFLEKFIPELKNVHQLLKEHFVDKRGKKLKNGCLRSSLNQIRNNNRMKIIDDIIVQLGLGKD